MTRKNAINFLKKAIAYILLTLGALTMVIPFLWMISTALKDRGQLFFYPPVWIPKPIMWRNFIEVFEVLPFALFFFNSLKIALWGTIGTLISCAAGAY